MPVTPSARARCSAEALETDPAPALRAEIDHQRGRAALLCGPVMVGHDILVEGAARAHSAAPARAVVMLAEAADACVYAARPEAMLLAARRSWRGLRADAGDRERFLAGLALGRALIYNGRGDEGAELVREAIEVLERSDPLSDDPLLLSAAALGPLWLRDASASRALIARAIESARRTGAVGALPVPLWLAARDAATSDRWPVAEAQYREAIRLARETGQSTSVCAALAGLACVEARRGQEEPCRDHASEAIELADRLGLGFFRIWALDALAELELGLGRVEDAIARLEEKRELIVSRRIADPDNSPVPELIEAYVRAGRERGSRSPRRARARGRGEGPAVGALPACALPGTARRRRALDECFEAALRLHGLTPDRFEEARTRLCFGERLRRARRRVQAREQLRRAFDAFDELGAEPWAERARLELLATGETARRRDASTLDQLTPRERQVALALAEGKTTREAAAMLFLSPKTIEYHLRNAYRKLEIGSREELAARLGKD